MRFIPVRELRSKSAQVWKKLAEERDLVITSNGRPIAIMNAVSEDDFEETLETIRRTRALVALAAIRRDAKRRGLDRMTMKEIDAEIQKARQERRRRAVA